MRSDMSDDIASDRTLLSKLAKLEARMVCKSNTSPLTQSGLPSGSMGKPGGSENFQASSLSSSSDDDNHGYYLIQRNIHMRQRDLEDDHASIQSEEISLLHSRIASLEEEIDKSRQEALNSQQEALKSQQEALNSQQEALNSKQKVVKSQQLNHQLEKELKDLKDNDQKMKIKQFKTLSDLLISVSKEAERQEAGATIQQESLMLDIVRAGTIISDTWEDGKVYLKSLLETKEAIDRHRMSLKKRQQDKGYGTDSEAGISEAKSRLTHQMVGREFTEREGPL